MVCPVTDGRDECGCCTLRCWSLTILTCGLIGAILLAIKPVLQMVFFLVGAAQQRPGYSADVFAFILGELVVATPILLVNALAVFGAYKRRRNYMIPFIVIATTMLVLEAGMGVYFVISGSRPATYKMDQEDQEAEGDNTAVGIGAFVMTALHAALLFVVWRYYIFLGLRQRSSTTNQSAQPQHIQMCSQVVIDQPSNGAVKSQSQAPPPYAEKLSV